MTIKRSDVAAEMERYYTAKWSKHSGFWRDQYHTSQIVYATCLYDRRNTAILNCTPAHVKRVLDIGCGVGDMMSLLSAKADSVTGVDIALANAKQARNNLLQSKIENASIFQGNTDCLPFEDDTFDLIVMGDVIEHIPAVDGALREIKRVLAPGGIFICVTPRKHMHEIYARVDNFLLTLLLKIRGRKILQRQVTIYERFLSSRELGEALQRNGFEIEWFLPICFYPGPEGGGTFGLAMSVSYKILGPKIFGRLASVLVFMFHGLEQLRVLNQKQLWVARN